MTVGKLKEYLDDIDDNVEIEGLILRCENGYAIQSKMRWIDNEDTIAELEKIIEKIDFEEKWLFDVYAKEYKVSIKDIEIAMSGIRSIVSELKG